MSNNSRFTRVYRGTEEIREGAAREPSNNPRPLYGKECGECYRIFKPVDRNDPDYLCPQCRAGRGADVGN